MRKEYDFSIKDDSYVISENSNVVFSISKGTLDFDGKTFYDVFYSSLKKDDKEIEIILKNKVTDEEKKVEKTAQFTFETVQDIFNKINAEINKKTKNIKR